ncbi:hypothetical protein HYR99_34805 [Candidatus Poribacteria bacterium]|nr:hypothetical protein [Candidatus Poribacteria bacterium]
MIWLLASRAIVYGYHGTSIDSADAILQSGFEVSHNDYDWLGKGIYFFQEAPQRAWEWATDHHSNPAVIGALIEINNFIDLLDLGWFEILNESYHLLVDEYTRTRRQVPDQNRESGAHRLDCAVIDFAIDRIENTSKIYGVRAAFAEGEPVFENSALLDRTHVQIAVRDPSVIKHIWLEKGR